MTLRRLVIAAAALALLGVGALPTNTLGQECSGFRPRGGRWVASGELYLDRARRNPRVDEKLDLYRQALDVLIEGFVEQPENPQNYLLAGQAFEGLGDFVGADSVWRKAEEMWSCYHAKIDTLRYRAWTQAFNRAVGYYRQGETERAVADYEKAYTVYDRLPQPLLQLGNIYAQQAMSAETEESRSELRQRAIAAFETAIVPASASPAGSAN